MKHTIRFDLACRFRYYDKPKIEISWRHCPFNLSLEGLSWAVVTIQDPVFIQVVNPLLILAFISVFDYVVYPLLAKCSLFTKPLAKIFLGGILAGVAFAISGLVELALEVRTCVPGMRE